MNNQTNKQSKHRQGTTSSCKCNSKKTQKQTYINKARTLENIQGYCVHRRPHHAAKQNGDRKCADHNNNTIDRITINSVPILLKQQTCLCVPCSGLPVCTEGSPLHPADEYGGAIEKHTEIHLSKVSSNVNISI